MNCIWSKYDGSYNQIWMMIMITIQLNTFSSSTTLAFQSNVLYIDVMSSSLFPCSMQSSISSHRKHNRLCERLYFLSKNNNNIQRTSDRVASSCQSLLFQRRQQHRYDTKLFAQQQQPSGLSESEVKKGIDKVVTALRKDARANQELGKLQRVTIVLGYGTQQMNTILAVRFNASFQKSGMGLSSIPLPFGLGQSNVREGRGTMVGQVKASINMKTGKVIACSVFRDLGYGRTFDLKL